MSRASGRKVLIITSSGGGGLLQAANAKQQEILLQDPSAMVIQRDVMRHWMWKGIGKFFVRQWNEAQNNGNVRKQVFFGTLGARIIEYFFWPHIFVCSLVTFFRRDIDQVIDTQVMGTSAIIKALKIFHRRKNKMVQLEKVLVDLPTAKATHFFNGIRKLSHTDKNYFRLITIAPLLEEGETEELFWKRHCNLTGAHLRYEDYYVRQAFRAFRGLGKVREEKVLRTRFHNEEEREWIEKCLQAGSLRYSVLGGEFSLEIQPNDWVFTVLLGSQPSLEGTMGYVREFIKLAQERDSSHRMVLFVFCANHTEKRSSLLQRVSESILSHPNYPKHLTVIPMSFQSEAVLAPLFHRSDITCTRSGGQTAMELMTVGTGQIWIHSETKSKKKATFTNEELLAGIPVWESANAVYMQRMFGAKIVTPDTMIPLAKKVMESPSRI